MLYSVFIDELKFFVYICFLEEGLEAAYVYTFVDVAALY